MVTTLGCCMCYVLGALTALISIRMADGNKPLPDKHLPTAEPATTNEAEPTKEEQAWRAQWQELLDYNPYKKPEEGEDINATETEQQN